MSQIYIYPSAALCVVMATHSVSVTETNYSENHRGNEVMKTRSALIFTLNKNITSCEYNITTVEIIRFIASHDQLCLFKSFNEIRAF